MNDPWAPYTPDGAGPWNAVRAAHLLRRAGFGYSAAELRQAVADGPGGAADRLLRAPAGLAEFERRMASLGGAIAVSESTNSDEAATLWLHRIAETPYPLLDKATLFWHDHFAVAGARAGKVVLIEQHLRLLRQYALGRFDQMLVEVVRDPATMLACDARSAPKAKPPLTLARALSGRWTTGGAAGEREVRDAARALTGASVLRDQYHFQPADHDGERGAAEAAAAAARHPGTARHIARRAWQWFVSDAAEPDDRVLDPLAAAFARDLDFGKLVNTILRSELFYSDAAIGQKVKSPVEFAFGIVKAAGLSPAPAMLHRGLSSLGQRLLEPPTRDGWAGGRRWLNQFTLVGRANFAQALLGSAQPEGDAKHWWQLLLQRDPPDGETRRGREAVLAVVTSAGYQAG
jgi:uncharacterized protein (DUF1800 family)